MNESFPVPEQKSEAARFTEAIAACLESGDTEKLAEQFAVGMEKMETPEGAEWYDLVKEACASGVAKLGRENMRAFVEERFGDPRPEHAGRMADEFVG